MKYEHNPEIETKRQDPKIKKATLELLKVSHYIVYMSLLFMVGIAIIAICFVLDLFKSSNTIDDNMAKSSIAISNNEAKPSTSTKEVADAWKIPDINALPNDEAGNMVRYGKELIAHTADYLGPEGSVAKISNGMNCQNCHLDAGTKFLGNNYSAVFSTYPKFRARSGTKESIVKRISDCFDRSLNGKAPDSTSKEMRSMIAYMKFLGTNVTKGTSPSGAGLEKLPFLNRATSPEKGAVLYQAKCIACHGTNGEGILASDKKSFTYPPLWGAKSYNDGAGLYRISNFAGYIKNNMPLGATNKNPMLTDEEAWDIAAFINSRNRPHKDQNNDWSNVGKKPTDFPFGPYSDQFSEKQHKFGPYKPIKDFHKNQ